MYWMLYPPQKKKKNSNSPGVKEKNSKHYLAEEKKRKLKSLPEHTPSQWLMVRPLSQWIKYISKLVYVIIECFLFSDRWSGLFNANYGINSNDMVHEKHEFLSVMGLTGLEKNTN